MDEDDAASVERWKEEGRRLKERYAEIVLERLRMSQTEMAARALDEMTASALNCRQLDSKEDRARAVIMTFQLQQELLKVFDHLYHDARIKLSKLSGVVEKKEPEA